MGHVFLLWIRLWTALTSTQFSSQLEVECVSANVSCEGIDPAGQPSGCKGEWSIEWLTGFSKFWKPSFAPQRERLARLNWGVNRAALRLKSPQTANVGLMFGLCVGTAAGAPALRHPGYYSALYMLVLGFPHTFWFACAPAEFLYSDRPA